MYRLGGGSQESESHGRNRKDLAQRAAWRRVGARGNGGQDARERLGLGRQHHLRGEFHGGALCRWRAAILLPRFVPRVSFPPSQPKIRQGRGPREFRNRPTPTSSIWRGWAPTRLAAPERARPNKLVFALRALQGELRGLDLPHDGCTARLSRPGPGARAVRRWPYVRASDCKKLISVLAVLRRR